jgi:hypothetical protein
MVWAAVWRGAMLEKLCDVEEETADRRPALTRVREATVAVNGLDPDCNPVRCWSLSDLEAERSPRLTADMVYIRFSITNWSQNLRARRVGKKYLKYSSTSFRTLSDPNRASASSGASHARRRSRLTFRVSLGYDSGLTSVLHVT